jgi:hypothetical protein
MTVTPDTGWFSAFRIRPRSAALSSAAAGPHRLSRRVKKQYAERVLRAVIFSELDLLSVEASLIFTIKGGAVKNKDQRC